MKNMTLENIAHAVSGQLFFDKTEEMQSEITGVVTDNRQIQSGNLFVPIVGARVDGHTFIPDAYERGAMAVLSQHKLEKPQGAYILVESTEQALKDLAGFYRRQLTIPIVGIVGSVGKTSTKEMVASVLEEKYQVLKTEGNLNNEIGLPLTLCKIREEHQVAVVEMGISDFGEMHRLGAIAQPDMVVMTNIGQCHLENLKTRDGILKAKTEVFEHISPNGCVILNGDDDKLNTVAEAHGAEIIFYGCNEQEVSADHIENLGLDGMRAQFHTSLGQLTARIFIPGSHNVYNALAATAVGIRLGLSVDEIAKGIEGASTIRGRSNFIKVGGATIIDDCYNANPVSMKASLEVLSKAQGRTVAVLGDMGELGEEEQQLHYQVGEAVADNHIDVLYTAGTLTAQLCQAVREQSEQCEVHEYREVSEMIEGVLKDVQAGDTILVKASHFMEFPKVVEAIREHMTAE